MKKIIATGLFGALIGVMIGFAIIAVKLAEKELQRKQIAVAKAISEDVIRQNPQNKEAKMVKGYAELKGGDLKAAEKTFKSLSRSKGSGQVLGEEVEVKIVLGQIMVGDYEGAKSTMNLVQQLEKKWVVLFWLVEHIEKEYLSNNTIEFIQNLMPSRNEPESRDLLIRLGELCLDIGNKNKAKQLFREAAKRHSTIEQKKDIAQKPETTSEKNKGHEEALETEGLISVYNREEQTKKALKLAEKVKKKVSRISDYQTSAEGSNNLHSEKFEVASKSSSVVAAHPDKSTFPFELGKLVIFPLLFGTVGFILSILLKPALEAFGKSVIAPAIAEKLRSAKMLEELQEDK